jgi:galactokinase
MVSIGSGLSSTAAMVVASALAFLVVNNKLECVTKRTPVDMGMETREAWHVAWIQAASVMSIPDFALYVTFHPHLAASSPVTLPPGSLVLAIPPSHLGKPGPYSRPHCSARDRRSLRRRTNAPGGDGRRTLSNCVGLLRTIEHIGKLRWQMPRWMVKGLFRKL